MWSRILAISLVTCLLTVSQVRAEPAQYNEQFLQNGATANGNGTLMAVDRYSSIAVDVTITGTATVTFQGSVEGSAASSVTCTLVSTGAATQTATTTGMYQCNVAGFKAFRAPISGYSSGSVTVYARATTAILGRGSSGGGAGSVTSVDATGGVQTTTGSPITTTGTIRGAGLVNAQTGTTYTVLTTDRGNLVTFSNASPVAVTQPVAGGTFPSGWYVDFQNRGAGTVTITPTTSTVDGAASVALGTNAGLRLFSDGTNYFTQRGTGGSGGAPIDAGYITDRANASLSNEISLGALSTGALIGTVGAGISTISAYAGVTCTNQVLRILSTSLAGTCNTITSAFVDTSVWTGTAASGLLKATSQGVLTAATSGSDYANPGTTNSWADGVKQTFNPDATNAGVNVGAHTDEPASPVDGDIFYESDITAFKFYENGAWRGLGIAALSDTLDTVFDRGKVIDGANSFANRFEVGDGGATPGTQAFYTHATFGPQHNCVVSAVENDCDYTRWLLTGKTFSFLANDRTTAIGTITAGAASGAWTNVTLDTEATGNVITTSTKINIKPVGCSGTTGTLNYDTNATLAPTATCVAGSTNTTLMQSYADFPDSDGEYQFQYKFRLPADWAGAIDLQLFWKAAATTGDVVWQVATLCRADAEIEDAAWNTAQQFAADTAKGTTLQLNTVTLTSLTTTGCAAGEMFYFKIFRQRTHASDTITGVVSLSHGEMTIRRAQ